jgi:MoxR-like ATPase
MNGILKKNFIQLWKKVTNDIRHAYNSEEIVGHDDIKQIFVKAILSRRPIHLLLVGSPGSAKTMFLTEIMRRENHLTL